MVYEETSPPQKGGKMQQQSPSRCSVLFLEWLDNLTDEEHHEFLLQLRAAANELGCRVNRHPFAAEQLLDILTHDPPMSFLN